MRGALAVFALVALARAGSPPPVPGRGGGGDGDGDGADSGGGERFTFCSARDDAQKVNGGCCRRYGLACRYTKFTGCGLVSPNATAEPAKARWCCMNKNRCPVACERAFFDTLPADKQARCCDVNGVCTKQVIDEALKRDEERDTTERKAGKQKRDIRYRFKDSFDVVLENPVFVVGRIRRAILEKAGNAGLNSSEFYVTHVGKVLEDGTIPTSATDVAAYTVRITREMNTALEVDEAEIRAAGDLPSAAGGQDGAGATRRGVVALQTDDFDVDTLYFDTEIMSADVASLDTLVATIDDNAAVTGGYGFVFEDGPAEDEDGSGVDPVGIAMLVLLGFLVVALVAVGLRAKSSANAKKYEKPVPLL